MIFTDDDVQILKEHIAFNVQRHTYEVTVNYEDLEALLARLEASEQLIESVRRNDATIRQDEFLRAWRKSAGKMTPPSERV